MPDSQPTLKTESGLRYRPITEPSWSRAPLACVPTRPPLSVIGWKTEAPARRKCDARLPPHPAHGAPSDMRLPAHPPGPPDLDRVEAARKCVGSPCRARSSRARGYPRGPLTPPDVRFRIRRFLPTTILRSIAASYVSFDQSPDSHQTPDAPIECSGLYSHGPGMPQLRHLLF